MQRKPNPNTPPALVFSWVAAIAGGLLAILFSTVGQALGAMAGGCRWIGLSLPIQAQPWALVNQPSLAFSSQTAALGYWLGGIILCLVVALLTVGYMPRPKKLSWELTALQLAWGAAVVGLAWIPLLDPRDGHLSALLRLKGAPAALVWIVPVIAGWAGLLPTARLLALARAAGTALPRWKRMLTVAFHLAFPMVVIIAVGLVLIASRSQESATRIELTRTLIERLWPPAIAAMMPIMAAFGLAWTSIPQPSVVRLDELRFANVLPLVFCLTTFASVIVVLGRPLPEGRCGGVLWSVPDSRNNIRPWVEPIELFSAGQVRH